MAYIYNPGVQRSLLLLCSISAHAMRAANPMTAPWMPFLSGAMAGTAGTIASYPFDLLRTTMAAQGEPRVRAKAFYTFAEASMSPFGLTLPGVRHILTLADAA